MNMDYRMTLGGHEVRLRYTVNSLCAMEERAGGKCSRMKEKQFSSVRLLLWGGMIALKPETTLSEAGTLIDAHLRSGGTLAEVVDGCAEAMRLAGFA